MKKEEPKFISLAEAAKLTNYSQDYISLLCRQGKLRAEKLGRNWVTTKEWVYSYVDNTEGKGESIVPVRVRESVPESKDIKSEKKESKRNNRKEKTFYGQSVLEAAFFCFSCLIWSINIFMFVTYWREGNFSPDTFATTNDYSVSADEASGRSDGTDSSQAQGAQDSAAAEMAGNNLLAFEKETDPAAIERRTAEIKATLGQDVVAEIYGGFAVVVYKDNPGKKFLYIFK